MAEEKIANTPSARVIKPGFVTYLFFAGVPAIALVMALYAFLFVDPTTWPLALFFFLLFLAGAAGIARFKIVIEGESLTYRSLLAGPHSLNLSEIFQAVVDVRFFKKNQFSKHPPFALIVEPKSGIYKKPILINMKMFGRDDLKALLEFLGDKVVDKEHRIVDGVPQFIQKRSGQNATDKGSA